MGKLDGKEILMIIASNQFRDEEYLHPRSVFENEGANITVASSKTDKSIGVKGGEVVPDTLISDVNVLSYNAVVFVGGGGSREYFSDPTAHKIARDAFSSSKVLGAICIAPVILANAGLLKGKKATVYSSEIETIKAKGAEYTGKPVEEDGNIITGNGPEAAFNFGNKIVEKLTG